MAISNKLIIMLLALFLLVPIASGLECYYSDKPLIKPNVKITWVCYAASSEVCISWVSYNNELIQVNPVTEYVKDFGMVDKFHAHDGLVHVYFRPVDLRDGKEVTFGVDCDDGESFTALVTPQYKVYDNIFDRMVWIRENAGYIIGAIFIIIVILSVLIWLWKQRK